MIIELVKNPHKDEAVLAIKLSGRELTYIKSNEYMRKSFHENIDKELGL